ncbi:DUF4129 domain-containing protein [Bacillus sp. DTU_2020_1000418_1_SI_GHA_SEK_038]|uniref:DUF4129 domain-containing protein n=1 Tax=Bacillus sp. DTU_2020_1000418_1_SI_GHA_SEK_038 TaxID=3077585 RepID=UPI0028E5B980|nr:DUF4129 domain-containing protein [Bacillus sp. DTU_2020_1000418_1_SI_GHA_SEK_038]WNS77469.1 DUF4129 domain-containing protein [Bacillus sp. DTU_2020_1000418_1_SI_GHA_SEK_038]
MLETNKAKDELQRILDGKEYRVYYNDSKSMIEIWWEEAKKWIAEQLSKLFPSIESTSGASGLILIIILIIVVVLLSIAVFLVARNMKRNRMLRDQKPLQSMQELNWTFQEHLLEARKLEALGDYTLSTRHMFLALLLYLHEKEWLEARIWKTNWEYYDELQKINPSWAENFYHLAHLFDEATYGEREITKVEYDQFCNEAMFWLQEPIAKLEG